MNIAIIVAAGEGRRLGVGRGKQFLDLCGQPLLIHTLRVFEQCPDVSQVVLVLRRQDREQIAAELSENTLKKVTRIVEGGPARQDSVERGLRQIDLPTTEVVIVHDGARPLISPEQISRVVNRARLSGAAILAIPVTDTIKEIEADRVIRTLDRERLYQAQTPQAFRAEILLRAHQWARTEGLRGTDDAALVERFGFPVSVVEGSRYNIKITWPEDLALAEFLLKGSQPS